mgnify:CR=1 FL=1
MTSVSCPTCGSVFEPVLSTTMPFCSERCRSIDLNRWLNEEISLPYRDADESDAPPDEDE